MSEVKLSYTNRDFRSARKDAVSQIPRATNEWTDFNPSDPGMVLVDLVYALGDMIQYYQDHQALESFMEKARERKNILTHARRMSYKPKSASGARALLKVWSRELLKSNVIINKYDVFKSTHTGAQYLAIDSAILYVGQSSTMVPVIQGERRTLTYTGTGAPHQIVTLPAKMVDDDTVVVKSTDGEYWDHVDFVVLESRDRKCYETSLTPDDHIVVKFASLRGGRPPAEGEELIIEYLVTAGEEGRVGPSRIDKVEGNYKDTSGGIVYLECINEEGTSGGTQPEQDSSIKENAPRAYRTVWKALLLEDYEVLAKQVKGVSQVRALDYETAPDLCLHYEIKLVVVPEGGGRPTNVLKEDVFQYLRPRISPLVVMSIVDPQYQDIDFNVALVIDKRFLREEVQHFVRESLSKYLSSLDFGAVVKYTDIIAVIRSTKGVRSIQSITLTDDIELLNVTLPLLGEVNIDVVGEV